jgi:hypothetical protein
MLKRPAHARLALMALAAAFFAVPARAQDELHSPYDLTIVLHVAEHRLLGEVFRERLTRELRDGLQAALGDLARVRVVSSHPRLRDVLRNGLDRALDGWVERSTGKTHFVLIDIAGAEYEIQARQHDGPTGRAGRVVRRDRTRDRDVVARAAALLVAQDFGLLGTVLTEPDGQKLVRVEMKAGALGPLGRWLRKGQVFEILPPGGGAAKEWALLQLQEPPSEADRSGVVVCRLLNRYRLEGSLIGFRCLLLGTTKGPLRLRFVQERTRGVHTPLDHTLTLVLRRAGFSGEDSTRLAKSTDPAGWVDTTRDGERGVFEDVAFVSITGGIPPPLPQVPVAILDDRPVFIPVAATVESGSSLFAARKATWERSVADSCLVQASLFKELLDLSAKSESRAQAMQKARAGLQRTKDEFNALKSEREALAQEAARAGSVAFNPTREDQRLKELQDGENSLRNFLGEQEQIERDENDPKKREWRSQIQRARLLEQDVEIGKAIAIYEKVLKEGMVDPELRKYRDQLKAMWEPKSQRHREARAFIYNVWPTLDNFGLKQRLPEAEQAFAECRQVKDLISPRKLFKATEAHAVRMKKELDGYQPKINIDDEAPARLIEEVTPGLTKLANDIVLFLQKEQPVEP